MVIKINRAVLVTRPQPAAEDFANRLRAAGFLTHVAPLSEYEEIHTSMPEVSGYQAFIFTSAEGVRVFSRCSAERNLPVLAVGDMTAATAADVGFKKIYSAGGDSDDLAGLLVSKRETLTLQKVLHVCGADTPEDIGAVVEKHGVDVVRLPVYRARLCDKLPENVTEALRQGNIDIVTLFSARAAAHFAAFLHKDALRGASAHLEAACLSPRVAAELKPLPWKAVHIAGHPDMDGMMELLAVLDITANTVQAR